MSSRDDDNVTSAEHYARGFHDAEVKYSAEIANTEAERYCAITELIGEMSWGVDLPSPIVLHYVEELGGEVKSKAMTPRSMEPIFSAIYHKLKTAPNYNPLREANMFIAELKGELENANEHLRLLKEYPETKPTEEVELSRRELEEMINRASAALYVGNTLEEREQALKDILPSPFTQGDAL